jgi:hypothetical protein
MTTQTLPRVLAGAIASLALLALTLAPARAGWSSLNSILPGHTTILNILFSPDSRWVVFKADIARAAAYELYSVPLEGGELNRLNPPLPVGGYVRYAEITPDGSRVL